MHLKLVFVVAMLCIVGLVIGANPPPNRGPARGAPRPENIMQDVRIRNENTRDPADPRESTHMNPVSRLNLIQMNKKAATPTYELVEVVNMKNEKNATINKRFRVQVKLEDFTADAWGLTKKEAKREAARSLLTKMNLAVAR